jgi:hypothetical protein
MISSFLLKMRKRPDVNRSRPGWTWEVISDTLRTQIKTARIESSRVRGVRNLSRIYACGEALSELEDLIRRSSRWRDWEMDPEPFVETIKEEATEIGEVWATDLAARKSLWLQPHPQKVLTGILRSH